MFLIEEEEWKGTYRVNGKRHYMTPEGKLYPSVTTFLSFFEDNAWLEEWRAKKGEEEAARLTKRAQERGTIVHKVLEDYVTNSPNFDPEEAGKFRFMFNQIRKILDKRLDAVLYVEHALYSDKLKIAGRVDLCGLWNGELAIIDYKNKNRLSKRADIAEYFIQAATYAIMHAERYGVLPEKLVILLAVEIEGVREAQEMVERTRDWVPKVIDMARKHQNENPFYKMDLSTIELIPEEK